MCNCMVWYMRGTVTGWLEDSPSNVEGYGVSDLFRAGPCVTGTLIMSWTQLLSAIDCLCKGAFINCFLLRSVADPDIRLKEQFVMFLSISRLFLLWSWGRSSR